MAAVVSATLLQLAFVIYCIPMILIGMKNGLALSVVSIGWGPKLGGVSFRSVEFRLNLFLPGGSVKFAEATELSNANLYASNLGLRSSIMSKMLMYLSGSLFILCVGISIVGITNFEDKALPILTALVHGAVNPLSFGAMCIREYYQIYKISYMQAIGWSFATFGLLSLIPLPYSDTGQAMRLIFDKYIIKYDKSESIMLVLHALVLLPILFGWYIAFFYVLFTF